jgi:hypothetical protein
MKKTAIALLAVLFIGLIMSSCRSSRSSLCPAYGETSKYQIETRY